MYVVANVSICIICFTPLQCPHRPWADRQWGLCIFDDVIEHCSPTSFKLADYFLRPMLQALCDTSPEVRQAAAYGIGVMAQFGGESYRPFCTGMGLWWCWYIDIGTPRAAVVFTFSIY